MELVHPDLCFQDGNVALLAGGCHFLVHKGVLERHSPVFAQLFSAYDWNRPNPFRDQPILEVQDSVEDMAFFLLALYDGISHLKHNTLDFPNVSAVLRLATKYQVKRLRQDVLNGLSQVWPRTLPQWEIREANATNASGVYEPRKVLPHPILIINLARAVDAPYLLPSAFYDLSRCYPSDTAAGYKCHGTQELHHLSESDLTYLLKGREHASRFLSTFIVNELESREPTPSCVHIDESDPLQRRHCQAAFDAITFEILRDVNGVVCHRSSDPLFAIIDAELMQTRDEPAAHFGTSMRVCEPCRSAFSAAVDNARDALWRKLPEWFGLSLHSWP
ncbi:hypothetical protein M378DRAFT_128722 [Amanita muscaria Koide BX008]|uniref:BTB domain-containing protein n=1 Tax=Amanita muscaria (strain Koide BX008) TaxID=946122 RepID=A0A0C2X1H7_AMAMK|nr:hypothetical protein M378DRAFT_128722 [Amanita muscaria Koide BX008]